MKKILLFACIAVLAVSCQKDALFNDFIINDVDYTTESKVTSPYYNSDEDCSNVDYHGYPDQDGWQYLNPESVLASGKDHNVLVDHLITRKVLNVFGYPTLCHIDIWMKNNIPTSSHYGEVLHFADIYNWTDLNGNPLFNLNYEIAIRWDITTGTYSFPAKLKFMETGEDASEGHDEITLRFIGIDTVGYYL